MTTRAAIYTRISKDLEGTRLGVQRQEKLCRELAEQKGWEVAEVYVDDDISAYSGARRPAYEAMCQAIRDRLIDAVVVLDQDRLVRLLRELEGFITLADEHGTKLANVSGDLDLSTPDGRLTARIRGTVAQSESEKMSVRIKRQRQQMRDQGMALPNTKPFGFQSWRMEHHRVEAAAIRDAAERVLAGESLRSVARRWNADGLGSGQWEATAVKRILGHPRNIAKQTRGRKEQLVVIGDGAWEPILDRVTYERLQALFASRRRGHAGIKHLLSGLMVCGRCGSPMVASGSERTEGRFAYVCRKRSSVPEACGGMHVSGIPADAHVAGELLDGLDGAEAAARARRPDEGPALADELERLEERLHRLSEKHWSDPTMSEAEYEAARRGLLERIESTQRSLTEVRPVPRLSGDLRGAWGRMPGEARRAVVEAAGISVVCRPARVGAPRRFDPSRLEVVWPV